MDTITVTGVPGTGGGGFSFDAGASNVYANDDYAFLSNYTSYIGADWEAMAAEYEAENGELPEGIEDITVTGTNTSIEFDFSEFSAGEFLASIMAGIAGGYGGGLLGMIAGALIAGILYSSSTIDVEVVETPAEPDTNVNDADADATTTMTAEQQAAYDAYLASGSNWSYP